MTLREKYPEAWEDEKGTIWISQTAAESADWTYEHGDAFLENVIGWSWQDAEENWAMCQEQQCKRLFWAKHQKLLRIIRFVRSHWNFTRMFCGIVWRDWYGRISWSTAWKIAKDVCL